VGTLSLVKMPADEGVGWVKSRSPLVHRESNAGHLAGLGEKSNLQNRVIGRSYLGRERRKKKTVNLLIAICVCVHRYL
jgi:hypothetical protein